MIKIENDINWTDCILEIDLFGKDLFCDFDITPKEFLKYAVEGISTSQEKRERINVVLNSKLAIDCQIDSIIENLGFNYKKFGSPSINDFMQTAISDVCEGENKKISFIHHMGIAPKLLISQYRKIRNLLEHEYKLPTINQAKEFVELAELFINATNHRMGLDFYASFSLRNDKKQEKCNMYFDASEIIEGCISIRSSVCDKTFELTIESTETIYIELLSCIIKKQFNKIPIILGHDIPEEYINIKVYGWQ